MVFITQQQASPKRLAALMADKGQPTLPNTHGKHVAGLDAQRDARCRARGRARDQSLTWLLSSAEISRFADRVDHHHPSTRPVLRDRRHGCPGRVVPHGCPGRVVPHGSTLWWCQARASDGVYGSRRALRGAVRSPCERLYTSCVHLRATKAYTHTKKN